MYQVYFITHGYEVVYVGCTKQLLRQRWAEHCKSSESNLPLGQLIQKHGKSAFEINLLQSYELKERACKLEAQTIQMWCPKYNTRPDGQPGAPFGKTNPMYNPEVLAKKSGENHPLYGKSRSSKTRKKISETLTGHTLSGATRKKMSNSHKHPVWQHSNRVVWVYEIGFYQREIASFFGCSMTPIHNILKSKLTNDN